MVRGYRYCDQPFSWRSCSVSRCESISTWIYDNRAYKKGLRADWGFSCLVEGSGESGYKILFDTGTKGAILLANMEQLHINPSAIEEVFISHAHFDHTGGLSALLGVNDHLKLYVPRSVRVVSGVNVKEVISVSAPLQMHENVFSTGEIDHIEESMAVTTEKGVVLIVGCSHPRMDRILEAASQFGEVYAIVGGLHGFREFELFRDLERICPAHCTQHIQAIRCLYPEKYVEGGAGQVIEF